MIKLLSEHRQISKLILSHLMSFHPPIYACIIPSPSSINPAVLPLFYIPTLRCRLLESSYSTLTYSKYRSNWNIYAEGIEFCFDSQLYTRQVWKVWTKFKSTVFCRITHFYFDPLGSYTISNTAVVYPFWIIHTILQSRQSFPASHFLMLWIGIKSKWAKSGE